MADALLPLWKTDWLNFWTWGHLIYLRVESGAKVTSFLWLHQFHHLASKVQGYLGQVGKRSRHSGKFREVLWVSPDRTSVSSLTTLSPGLSSHLGTVVSPRNPGHMVDPGTLESLPSGVWGNGRGAGAAPCAEWAPVVPSGQGWVTTNKVPASLFLVPTWCLGTPGHPQHCYCDITAG